MLSVQSGDRAGCCNGRAKLQQKDGLGLSAVVRIGQLPGKCAELVLQTRFLSNYWNLRALTGSIVAARRAGK